MKLLLIHNNYGKYSGEEAVFDQQINLFKEMGHEVFVYRKTTEGFRGTFYGNLLGLLKGFYSPESVWDIRSIILGNRPDAVIIHNLYPYISPAILKYFRRAGIPVIMTVHNYRLICPTGLFFRNNQPCEDCLNGTEWNCIRYNCERSLARSIGYAGRNWYARMTKAYIKNVNIYACLTIFQTEKLVQGGFENKRMRIIPNFLDVVEKRHRNQAGKYVAISGRLSKEKGIDLLLEVARRTPDIPYVFAGSQREGDNILSVVPPNCHFLGHLSKEELPDFYNQASFLVMGSRWYEGFPMTILEAASYAKPAIGPAHGSFPEIIDHKHTGLLFVAEDVHDLQRQIINLWNNPSVCIQMGKAAFDKLKTEYSADATKKRWTECLAELITN